MVVNLAQGVEAEASAITEVDLHITDAAAPEIDTTGVDVVYYNVTTRINGNIEYGTG